MILVDTGGAQPEMEGHTQGHLKRKREDALFRIPKTSYFRTRYREISMSTAHSSEIET